MSARVPAGDLDRLLAEQVAYYRAVAPEYEDHTLPFDGGEELSAALEAFRPSGHVLELACGQGSGRGSCCGTRRRSRRSTRRRR